MKFGVRLAVQGEMGARGQGWDYTRGMALEAEALGFDSLWLPDHVINAHMSKQTPMLENWTVLCALAALTKKVIFAGHTFNNSLRHPAIMAKMAATFDVMFEGRLNAVINTSRSIEEGSAPSFNCRHSSTSVQTFAFPAASLSLISSMLFLSLTFGPPVVIHLLDNFGQMKYLLRQTVPL
jgi:hypothetical protein